MSRSLVVPAVAVAGYLAFHASVLYFLALLAGVVGASAETSASSAPFVDLLLVVGFGLQHSVMARPRFKRWWTRWCPPSLERTVYVLASSAALTVLCVAWQPLPGVLWDV